MTSPTLLRSIRDILSLVDPNFRLGISAIAWLRDKTWAFELSSFRDTTLAYHVRFPFNLWFHFIFDNKQHVMQVFKVLSFERLFRDIEISTQL